MGTRLGLQTLLEGLLVDVYFQPPESFKINYPCIVFSISDIDTKFADDNPYRLKKRYTVTLIDKNPDNITMDKLAFYHYVHLTDISQQIILITMFIICTTKRRNHEYV